jgi:hypothetical protein
MVLLKYKKISYQRVDEDTFIARFLDDEDNVLMTLEPREIEVGDTYVVVPGTTGVIQVDLTEM